MEVSHNEAIACVTEALKAEGFGVLTRADVDQAFRDKIGVEFRPILFLGPAIPNGPMWHYRQNQRLV